MSDVLIVGGGSAGCVLAARLSEDPSRVVTLLEAGRDVRTLADVPPVMPRIVDRNEHDAADIWSYDVSLIPGERGSTQYRGRVLGGSSSINGSLFMRGIPEDYDSWGGPWSYRTVLDYFKRIERDTDFGGEYHGQNGVFDVSRKLDVPLPPFQSQFLATALATGIDDKPDLNHPDGHGIGRIPVSFDDTARTCTSLKYLGAIRDRPNLTIMTDVVVERVVIDSGRAVGVLARRDGQPIKLTASEIVLSAGAFGSPQLLMLSGIGDAEHLRTLGVDVALDLPAVGSNLSCHPSVVVRRSAGADHDDPESPRIVVVHSSASGRPGERNDVNIFPRTFGGDHTILVTLRLPESRGQLRLRSNNPAEKPRIAYGYLDAHDSERIIEAVTLSGGLAGWNVSGEATESWVRRHLRTSDHACGTCSMGTESDGSAVVDDECRVHGVSGLRVADLSVVPRSVRAGPYATVVMLAERVADLIKG